MLIAAARISSVMKVNSLPGARITHRESCLILKFISKGEPV